MSLTTAFDPDVDLIAAALATEDELGKVIRAHFVVEQQLERLVKTTRAKVDDRTTFYNKVNLARAMGVPEKLCQACELLNRLRNTFAHDSKASIDGELTEKFLAAITAFFPKFPTSKGTVHNRSAGTSLELDYTELSQAQRVVLGAAFLSGLLGVLPKLFIFKPVKLAELAGLHL